jgi:hypothetical protein
MAMKTNRSIHQNVSEKQIEVRLGLIIAGIATAILCAIALLYEVRSANNEVVNLISTPHVVSTELPVKMINKIVVSVQGAF